MSPALRPLAFELSARATAVAALTADLRAKVTGESLPPRVRAHVDDVLDRAGLGDAARAATVEEARPLLAELRHFWLLSHQILARPEREPGWTHEDGATLASAGEVTAGFPEALATRIAPALDGLLERLDTGARFLDVGTGVGLLALGMARRFPSLQIVGVDTWAPSTARARAAVHAAGLDHRIEIRDGAAEALDEEAAYDLAWVPAPFVAEAALPPLLGSVRRALRPGGWLLFVTTRPEDDLFGAALRLHVALFGGETLDLPEIHGLLSGAGFVDVRPLPGPPGDFKRLVAARRTPLDSVAASR